MSKNISEQLAAYFGGLEAAPGFEQDSLQALQEPLVSLAESYDDLGWNSKSFQILIDICLDPNRALAYCQKLSKESGKYLFSGDSKRAEIVDNMTDNINALSALLDPTSNDCFPPNLPPEYFPKLGEFTEKHLRAIQDKLNGKENTPPKDDRAVKVHDKALLRQPGLGDNSGNLTAGNSSSPGPASTGD